MTNRLATIAATALLAVSIAPLANSASAMPIAPLDVKTVAPSGIETVQWRHWHGGWHGGGFGWGLGAGLIGGAIIAGALTSPYYGYYGPGPYYSYGYYPGPAYVVPGQGGAVAYCMQRYRSYDPRSGTFLGYDGYRHPCP
jgi:hypothetical protein